jgi:hypothetical protein
MILSASELKDVTDVWLCVFAYSAYSGQVKVHKISQKEGVPFGGPATIGGDVFELLSGVVTTKKMKASEFWYGKHQVKTDGTIRLTAWVEEGWGPLIAYKLCEDDCKKEIDDIGNAGLIPSQDQIDEKTNFLEINHKTSDCPSKENCFYLFGIISNEMAITASLELKFDILQDKELVITSIYQDVVDYGASRSYVISPEVNKDV